VPNTLAHLGVQGFATRASVRGIDPKWIYVGCVIPDLPWIIQRAAKVLLPNIDPYDLRLYVVIQASFLFCLLLSSSLAALSRHFWKTFAILGSNSFLHLFLDAFQIKWANGVHFIAPISWHLTQFRFFWPETFSTYMITAFGLFYIAFNGRLALVTPIGINIGSPRRLVAATILIAVYFAGPLLLVNGPATADNHFVTTLRDRASRPGRQVELDRARYIYRPSGGNLQIFSGEELNVEGVDLDHSALISVQGVFNSEDAIRVLRITSIRGRFGTGHLI
jgi:hypothetical protein